MQQKRVVTKNNENKHYINKSTMLNEVLDYKDSGIISESLHMMIYEMCKKIGNKHSFRNYTWKEDAVHDIYLKCLDKIQKFNPENYQDPNPFAYFTTIIFNSFIDAIKSDARYQKLKLAEYQKIREEFQRVYGVELPLTPYQQEQIREIDTEGV